MVKKVAGLTQEQFADGQVYGGYSGQKKEQTYDLDGGGAEVHSTERMGSGLGNKTRLYRWINIE